MKSVLRFISIPIALLALSCASAPEPLSITGDDLMDLAIEGVAWRGDNLKRLRARMRVVYGSLDHDGGGISASDYMIPQQRYVVRSRTSVIIEWLEQDLNGDGQVTRAELERYFFRRAWTPNSSNASRLIGYALKADFDKDDVVDFDEALVWAENLAAGRSPMQSHVWLNTILQLDKNADGGVSIDEFNAAVSAAFARIDQDVNGRLSEMEIAVLEGHAKKLRRTVGAEMRARRRAKITSR